VSTAEAEPTQKFEVDLGGLFEHPLKGELSVIKITLASASPRRAELLRTLGLSFEQQVSAVDETGVCSDKPGELAEALALSKAADVAPRVDSGLIIGADTIVVLDNEMLGKPASTGEAVSMLRRLSGRRHIVISGIAVMDAKTGKSLASHEETTVIFRPLSERVIQSYVKTGEPMDKAGAYGIQGRGALLVEAVNGCYFNVVGLPLGLLADLLEEFRFDIWAAAENGE